MIGAANRAQRLLTLVPWLVANPASPVDEVCRRFGLTRKELLGDLEVLPFVGAYPFSPGDLVDVVIDDDRITVSFADFFSRSLRLTPEQGLALVAAGAALLEMPGAETDGPLARGLAKLAGTIGVQPGDDVGVDLGSADPAVLETLRAARRDRRQVEIDHYAYGRDEWATRVIEPSRVVFEEGNWYVVGYCHRAADVRRFRVERISSARLLDRDFEVADADVDADRVEAVYEPNPDDFKVVLDLPTEHRWVAEQYPYDSIEDRPDGGFRITLSVSGTSWLERLLLRLGHEATVVSPATARTIASRAAERILERYQRV